MPRKSGGLREKQEVDLDWVGSLARVPMMVAEHHAILRLMELLTAPSDYNVSNP